MSYFDALMRSSGLVGHRGERVTPGLETGLGEVDMDAAPAREPPRASSRPQTPPDAPSPIRVARETPTPPSRMAPDTNAAPRATPSDGRPDGDSAADTPVVARPPLRLAVAPEQPARDAIVRAALEWVEAAVRPPASVPDASGARRDDATAALAGRVAALPGVAVPPADRDARATPPPAPQRVRSSPVELVPDPPRPSPLPEDDAIEISIGAIHVRVDAPGPQSAARPAPQPAPLEARRGPGRSPARSGLSRRALRRI